MLLDLAKASVEVAKEIQKASKSVSHLPSEITVPFDQPVLLHSLFLNTRGYIEKVVFQINRTYTSSSYDACAVMIRRLIETLIIEAFEHIGEAAKIKNSNGDYLYLQDLIGVAASETKWQLGRNTKNGLINLKGIGDQSAHSRRYNARRSYIDDVIVDLRTVAEKFLYLAGLRK